MMKAQGILTKDVDPQMAINWGEETIHEINETPGDVEGNGQGK